MTAVGCGGSVLEPPARSVGNYVVQAIAVATEVAPLQALAASTGMFELRLRLYDGSVHLWEELLDQTSDARLAPLALYRLGWAYRNQNTSGLRARSRTRPSTASPAASPTIAGSRPHSRRRRSRGSRRTPPSACRSSRASARCTRANH
jgi:hypothetical protein